VRVPVRTARVRADARIHVRTLLHTMTRVLVRISEHGDAIHAAVVISVVGYELAWLP